jgi:hypothetical protein
MNCLQNDMERATHNQYLLREEITDNIIIIKINRSYRRGMSPEELYDITRGCWKRRIESVDRAEFALAVYEGEVVEPCYGQYYRSKKV